MEGTCEKVLGFLRKGLPALPSDVLATPPSYRPVQIGEQSWGCLRQLRGEGLAHPGALSVALPAGWGSARSRLELK